MRIRHLAVTAPLLAALALVTVPLQGAADGAGPEAYEATVTKVVRQVEWQRHRTARWQKARLETLLLVGDTLRTGSESVAELRYGDGSVTRIGSLTSLTLTGDRKREIRLDSGKVWLNIKKSGAGMKIITPGAVAAVTGTELMVEFDPLEKITHVTVFEGAVNVTGDVGDLVRVLGGTTTAVPFRAPALAPAPLDNRQLQERNNLFKPLSVEGESEGAQPDTKQPEAKQPESNEGEAKQPEAVPEVPVSEASAAPVAETQPEVPAAAATVAPEAPAVEPDKKAIAPDLKGQIKELNDPRLINGSPTTGSVRVIIE